MILVNTNGSAKVRGQAYVASQLVMRVTTETRKWGEARQNTRCRVNFRYRRDDGPYNGRSEHTGPHCEVGQTPTFLRSLARKRETPSMDSIRDQIRRAHRRLLLNRLVESVTWATFASLLLALVAIAVPKIWAIGLPDGQAWSVAWIVGALVFGISTGVLWAVLRQRGELDAAIEIDLRYGLKERIASALLAVG